MHNYWKRKIRTRSILTLTVQHCDKFFKTFCQQSQIWADAKDDVAVIKPCDAREVHVQTMSMQPCWTEVRMRVIIVLHIGNSLTLHPPGDTPTDRQCAGHSGRVAVLRS